VSRARELVALLSLTLWSATALWPAAALRAQPRTPPRDETSSALDVLVFEERLVALERTACDAARAFEASECGALVARDLSDGHELWRAAVPIRLRGMIHLEPIGEGAHRALLVRAFDQAVIFDASGRPGAAFPVPPSAGGHYVGLRAVDGALVFLEPGGCSAYVVGRNDVAHGLYVRGVESHVYRELGEPHDTVCFGFEIHAVGEVRVGTRPAGRGRRGELRHALATRVLVAVTSLHHPVELAAPSVVAFDGTRVAYTTPVGADGERIVSAALRGERAVVVVGADTTWREVTLDARSGRRLESRALPAPPAAEPPPPPGQRYDRRGLVVPVFPGCRVETESTRHRVIVGGEVVLTSERPTIVLDQRGTRCVAVEQGGGPALDVVHLLSW
jgi:hypothetical protein